MPEIPTHPDPISKLIEIMTILRSEEGCPWDREQTHQSITPYLIEEAYEVVDAIELDNSDDMKEELGDVLLQVIFHAQMASESDRFDIDEIAEGVFSKLVRRHPHVFGEVEADSADEVLSNWEAIKSQERKEKGSDSPSMLAGIPNHLPALLKARRTQEKATRIGFDWDHIDEVSAKVDEELSELKSAMAQSDGDAIEDEMGDIFFALVNLSRFLKVDPERALRRTIDKFSKRFRYIEEKLVEAGSNIHEASLEQMDALWEEAKRP